MKDKVEHSIEMGLQTTFRILGFAFASAYHIVSIVTVSTYDPFVINFVLAQFSIRGGQPSTNVQYMFSSIM